MRDKLVAAMLAALLLAVAAPASADEGEEPPEGDATAGKIVLILADGFDLDQEAIEEFQEMDIGYGALFKLSLFAQVMETDIATLLAGLTVNEDGDYAFSFGQLKQSLTDEQLEALEGLPKNLGQLVAESHRPDHAGKKDRGDTQGKPPWAGPKP